MSSKVNVYSIETKCFKGKHERKIKDIIAYMVSTFINKKQQRAPNMKQQIILTPQLKLDIVLNVNKYAYGCKKQVIK